ncbi:YaaA family protein [Leucobacter albus]|uniref:YaaA family protein n=1 Tax=Leucobacter albus TaxID=272210 RepID=A0ABW3TPH2_9MICO
MQILLPPSETKRLGGRLPLFGEGESGAPAGAVAGAVEPVAGGTPSALSFAGQLGSARAAVREALVAVSSDEALATRALKLGKKNGDERLRNLELETSGVMPAIERYTGVLYDALDAGELSSEARRWVDEHVFVQSALFGLVRASDLIPGYRLSASSRLPGLGTALAKVWSQPHSQLLGGADYVLDLRSKDYAALAPLTALGARATDYLEIVARSDDGEVRALNHFNKAAKGDFVRRIAQAAPAVASRDDLLAWARSAELEMSVADDGATVRLVTVQGVPAGSR